MNDEVITRETVAIVIASLGIIIGMLIAIFIVLLVKD